MRTFRDVRFAIRNLTRSLGFTTGVGVGVAASLGLSELVRSQLLGVTPSDPLTIASVFALMTIVAAAAAYRPARRAASVDPIIALRA